MKFENVGVYNMENAIRGMRNPLNSWDKSDSVINLGSKDLMIGARDLKLADNLIKAGSSDRKFLRQILVSVDITAPLYWWKEMDQYKVGTVTNSQSTMHKLSTTPITLECFELGDYEPYLVIDSGVDETGDTPYKYEYHLDAFIDSNLDFYYENTLIKFLEKLRLKYVETKDIRYWKELIRWLPEGWLQTRTWTGNYEILRNIYHQRKNHKLTEWHKFCEFIETLPYAKEFILGD